MDHEPKMSGDEVRAMLNPPRPAVRTEWIGGIKAKLLNTAADAEKLGPKWSVKFCGKHWFAWRPSTEPAPECPGCIATAQEKQP